MNTSSVGDMLDDLEWPSLEAHSRNKYLSTKPSVLTDILQEEMFS